MSAIRWLRLAAVPLVFIAVVSNQAAFLIKGPDRPDLLALGSLAISAAAHLAYLVLVVHAHIGSKTFDQCTYLDIALPYCLCAVYISGVVEAWLHRPPLHEPPYVTYGLFLVLYIIWIIHDIVELSHETSSTQRRRRGPLIGWIIVDFGIALTLTVVLASSLGKESAPDHPQRLIDFKFMHLYVKDWLILVAIFAWGVLNWFRQAVASGQFMQQYKSWVSQNQLDRSVKGSPDYQKLTARFHEALACRVPDKGDILVVDFASACSTRTMEVLELGGIDLNRVILLRVDMDSDWADLDPKHSQRLRETVHCTSTAKCVELMKNRGLSPHIVVSSHSLYGQAMIFDLGEFLTTIKSPFALVARGYGPNSFLAGLLVNHARKLSRPAFSHLWNTWTLHYLMETAGLRPTPYTISQAAPNATRGKMLPSLVIPQRFRYNSSSKGIAVGVMEALYGRQFADVLDQFLSEALEQRPTSMEVELDNQNYVFVLETSS